MPTSDEDKPFHSDVVIGYNSHMTDAPEQKTILAFPYQEASLKDLEGCYDIDIRAFQTRLTATKIINAIQAGRMEASKENTDILKRMNCILKEWGKPELLLDFLE